jgi:hypothetical protein
VRGRQGEGSGGVEGACLVTVLEVELASVFLGRAAVVDGSAASLISLASRDTWALVPMR